MSDANKPNENPGPTIGSGPGQIPASGVPPTGSQTLRIVRQGIFKAAKKTMEFIDNAERDKGVKVRVDDRRSAQLLIGALVAVISCIGTLILNKDMRPLCIGLGVLADVLLGCSIVWYVILRFGILQKLDPRYAVLTFQLLLGTGVLFAYFAFNVVIFFLSVVFNWGSTPPPVE